jgi:membrane protease YdiL (CAAX protease family)
MNDYSQSLLALLLAFGAQSLVAGLATEVFLRKEIASSARHGWLALAIAALLFSLHHGYSLELALRTGLYDLRQALISALAALLLAYAVNQFRRRA